MGPAYADFLASLIMLGGLIGPLLGFISDRMGRRRLLIIIALLVVVISFLLVPSFDGAGLVFILAFLGLAAATLHPLLFALLPEILDSNDVALGFGTLAACIQLGVVAGPFLTGVVIDVTHDLTSPLLTMAFFSLAAVIFSLMLKAR